MTTHPPANIVIYGTAWCGASNRARRLLDQNQIPYTFVDIDKDDDGRRFVQEVNHGYRSVPTIVFPDGSILVEPPLWKLERKLGIEARGQGFRPAPDLEEY
jgi:mycoredoxin